MNELPVLLTHGLGNFLSAGVRTHAFRCRDRLENDSEQEAIDTKHTKTVHCLR